eukprot:1006720_1
MGGKLGCMYCMNQYEKNEIFVAENHNLKAEIAELEKNIDNMKGNANVGEDYRKYDQIKQQNQRITEAVRETPQLKNKINKNKLRVNSLQQTTEKLTNDIAGMHHGIIALYSNAWKPLAELIHKFDEFDLNKSGYIDRDEFHKLCDRLESELTIARIYSNQPQHSASSVYNNDKPKKGHNRGTIDSEQAWSAQHNNKQQWYQIDANITASIAGILIQGRKNQDQWIKTFKVSYSQDGQHWNELDTLFNGN